jgi:hypothetical protein
VREIRNVMKRKKMKVELFGRKRKGKRYVINEMLSEKIIKSGIGNKKNCLLKVEG